jgi:hypothetical protein
VRRCLSRLSRLPARVAGRSRNAGLGWAATRPVQRARGEAHRVRRYVWGDWPRPQVPVAPRPVRFKSATR